MRISFSLVQLFLLTLLFASCSGETEKIEIDPAFGEYISSYTSGVISVADPIYINLAAPYTGALAGNGALPKNLLSFDPEIDGVLSWHNKYTLIYEPSARLKGNTKYIASLDLASLMDVKNELELFRFDFQTVQQAVSIYKDGLETYDPANLLRIKFNGRLQFADAVDLETVQNSFTAHQDGKELRMTTVSTSLRSFKFTVDDISRGDDPSQLMLKWNLNDNGQDLEGSRAYDIPALGDFVVMNVELIREPESTIEVSFSDPIKEMELNGLLSIEDIEGLKYLIEGNTVKIYPEGKVSGQKLLRISGSVRNTADKMMGEDYTETLLFESIKPKVRMVGEQSIIPTQDQGLVFPFEAVSLEGVDVYVTKIFSNNILQYLQTAQNNSDAYDGYYDDYYDSSYQLNRVGRNIFRKHIDLKLAGAKDLSVWNRYYIDLAEIVKADPGAFYEIDIRFKQSDAVYECDDATVEKDLNVQNLGDGWISNGTYFVDDYWADYRYDWDERENPCNPAYYDRYRSRVKKVVMATDLGLTAKMGGDGKLLIAATDLKTAKPIKAVQLQVFDYQQQLMAEARTDKDGFATIACAGEPFVVKASAKGLGYTYLKIDRGSALSVSKFEVQGSTVQEGIKGYIYGERGVWRPGDSLYLTFIMEDAEVILPKGHPVIMKFYNPLGQLVSTNVRNVSKDGFYDFRTATDPSAPTGEYRTAIAVGNRSFSKSIKVETVKPNRLKIDFEFDETTPGAQNIGGKLNAKWLTGATAENLDADVTMTLRAVKTAFDGYGGYHFDNSIIADFNTAETVVFDGALDRDGHGTVSIDMAEATLNAPGMLNASFNTKVYEPRGNFSVDYHSMPYAPYSSFAGIKLPESEMWGDALETDKNHQISLVSVNANGKPSSSKSLEVKVYRIDYRWWYDRYNGQSYNYLNSSKFREITSGTVALTGGKGTFPIEIAKPNHGRYLIHVEDKESGHSAARFVYFDWPYWMRANRSDGQASTILGFSSDKEVYATGEDVKLTFPSPGAGRALVSIENGTSILAKYWVETKQGETSFAFKATPEMAPNIFAHISLIQPHGQTQNDRPMRMYGIVPIAVENPESKLKPLITTAEVFRPETEVTVGVKEESGKPMTYTLAIVDEGLLSLTRFKTPDPWNAFYAKEALGVKTWDMYDQVVGAMTEGSGKALSLGGDGDAVDPGQQKAKRFKPMVHFLGPFTLAKGSNAKHKIMIPNYVGAVRVMVVAGDGAAYGNAEKEVPVRSPLMILGTLPRVLGPGETLKLPVSIFAMEEDVKKVNLKLTITGPIEAKGKKDGQIKFEQMGEELAFFDLATTTETGTAKVLIEASSGSHRARYEVDFDVLARNPYYTTVIDTTLSPGATWSGAYEAIGIEGTNLATLELSKLPAINLEQRLKYLISYPHGCIEQITSGAFPQLFLAGIVDLSVDQKVEIEENVRFTLKQYAKYQLPSGGFAYWPGNSGVSDWGTSYAGHFMLEAELLGYALPTGIKSQWIQHQKKEARRWNGDAHRDQGYMQRQQAYRLYTLAKAGNSDFGSMNAMKSRGSLDVSAQWMLALAYVEAGQPEAAANMIKNLSIDIPAYTELAYSYGSDMRDEGFVLQTLLALGKKNDAALVARTIAKRLGSGRYYSTQTVAYSLAALGQFLDGNTGNDGIKVAFGQSGKTKDIATGKALVQEKLIQKNGVWKYTVTNNSDQVLFTKLIRSGRPLYGREVREEQNLAMDIRYLDANRNPVDITRLKMGTDFIAEVTITNPSRHTWYREMALTQTFPSGWEILTTRLSGSSQANAADYQDIRDDRVQTYFDLYAGKSVTFNVRLNASYQGRYYMPAVVCNAMYDESISSIFPGRWIEVLPE